MENKRFYKYLFLVLDSKFSPLVLILFCLLSLLGGQLLKDMNLFASSGAVMTIFGLISMIKYTTIKKFLNQEEIANASTGVTGPPLSKEKLEALKRHNVEVARKKIKEELKSELKGISLTIIGTIIWAYGAYIPILSEITNT